MKNTLLLLFLIGWLSLSAQKYIRNSYRQVSLEVYGGMPFFHGDVNTKFGGFQIGGRVNWHITSAAAIGLEGGYGQLKGLDNDASQATFQNNYAKILFGGEYFFFNTLRFSEVTRWFQPYAGFSAGALKSDIKNASQYGVANTELFNKWAFATQLSAGFKFKVYKSMDLNLRYNLLATRTDFLDNYKPSIAANNNNDLISEMNVGVTFHFGKKGRVPFIWKRDNFEDAVVRKDNRLTKLAEKFDSLQAANDNIRSQLIDAASAAEEMKRKLAELEEKCAKRVEPNLTTALDDEDTTPVVLGLQKNKNYVIENLFFDYNSANLQTRSAPALNKLANTLSMITGLRILITGHTSSDGDDYFNLLLSQRRAQSVKRYLMDKGIDERRLLTDGKGESKPIADNNTPEGKMKNRRVEFKIVP